MAHFTTAEVAAKFDTTPRTLRKFLRADAKAKGNTDALPGKGSRYAIEGKALKSMQSRFTKWQADEAKARAERAEQAAKDAAEAVTEVEDEAPEDEVTEGE